MDESKEQKAGLKFLFIIATKEVLNCEVKFCHSLDTGMRGIFLTRKKVDYNDIKEITNKTGVVIDHTLTVDELAIYKRIISNIKT